MKVELLVIVCLLSLYYGACVPIGWSPALLSHDASVSHGPLAGVATSADPALVYSWLMRLFSQKAFLSWLGKNKEVATKPPSKISPPSVSTISSTASDARIKRLESEIPTVVRDYETSSAATSLKSATATHESTPHVARDFSGNNMAIIARTQKAQKATDGIHLTNLPLQVQGVDGAQQQLLSSSSSKATEGTTSETIEIVRDYYHEGNYNIESGNLNGQTPPSIPFVQINKGKMNENKLPQSTGSSSSSSTSSPVSQTVPKGLQIARDRMEPTGSTQSQPEVVKKKQPDGLVVIRDVIEDESQDPDRVIPTDSGNTEVRMNEATIEPGSNLVVLIPKNNFKFFG